MSQLKSGRKEKTLTPQHQTTTIVLSQGVKRVASDSLHDCVLGLWVVVDVVDGREIA